MLRLYKNAIIIAHFGMLRLGSATLTNQRSVTRLEYAQGIFK